MSIAIVSINHQRDDVKSFAYFLNFTLFSVAKSVGRKISKGGQRKKQDRKIAPLSLTLQYLISSGIRAGDAVTSPSTCF